MTYNVFGGTLNVAQSLSRPVPITLPTCVVSVEQKSHCVVLTGQIQFTVAAAKRFLSCILINLY